MACTVAVEEAIDEHYSAQLAALESRETSREPELAQTITRFREEELEHRDIGLANDAAKTPGYQLLSAAIKAGCKVAIRISERV